MDKTILHEYDDGKYHCILYSDGTFTVNGIQRPWYIDGKTQRPWLVKRYQNFKSLVKMGIKDGDYA